MSEAKDLKYKLREDLSIVFEGNTLYRIEALKDFYLTYGRPVEKGELGGYIDSIFSLRQEGACWVGGDAKVINSLVANGTIVRANAVLRDSRFFGCSLVDDYARLDRVICRDGATFSGSATVTHTEVGRDVLIADSAMIQDCNLPYDTRILGRTDLTGFHISTPGLILRNASITPEKFVYFKGLGSRNGSTYAYRTTGGDIWVHCGCFSGTLEKFEMAVDFTHKDCPSIRDEYRSVCSIIRNRLIDPHSKLPRRNT